MVFYSHKNRRIFTFWSVSWDNQASNGIKKKIQEKIEINEESKRKKKEKKKEHVKKVIGYHASGPLYQRISWSSLKAT